MSVTPGLWRRSDLEVHQPRFETTGPFAPTGADEPSDDTTGVADDRLEASRLAVRYVIDHLQWERGPTRREASLLCPAAVDLKVNRVVTEPTGTVSASPPRACSRRTAGHREPAETKPFSPDGTNVNLMTEARVHVFVSGDV
jgi:acetamidase/formamidase